MTINIDDLTKLLGEVGVDGWKLKGDYPHSIPHIYRGGAGGFIIIDETNDMERDIKTANFVFVAPTIIKELVELVRKLQRELDRTYNIIGQNIHPG